MNIFVIKKAACFVAQPSNYVLWR